MSTTVKYRDRLQFQLRNNKMCYVCDKPPLKHNRKELEYCRNAMIILTYLVADWERQIHRDSWDILTGVKPDLPPEAEGPMNAAFELFNLNEEKREELIRG